MFIIIFPYKFPIFKYLLLSIMLFYELGQQIITKCWSTAKKKENVESKYFRFTLLTYQAATS